MKEVDFKILVVVCAAENEEFERYVVHTKKKLGVFGMIALSWEDLVWAQRGVLYI